MQIGGRGDAAENGARLAKTPQLVPRTSLHADACLQTQGPAPAPQAGAEPSRLKGLLWQTMILGVLSEFLFLDEGNMSFFCPREFGSRAMGRRRAHADYPEGPRGGGSAPARASPGPRHPAARQSGSLARVPRDVILVLYFQGHEQQHNVKDVKDERRVSRFPRPRSTGTCCFL